MDGFNSTIMEVFAAALDVVLTISNIILYPFYAVINAFIPNIDDFFGNLSGLFDIASTYMAWALDALLVPSGILILIYAFFIFRFTVQFTVWNIKRIIIWGALIRIIGPKVI